MARLFLGSLIFLGGIQNNCDSSRISQPGSSANKFLWLGKIRYGIFRGLNFGPGIFIRFRYSKIYFLSLLLLILSAETNKQT